MIGAAVCAMAIERKTDADHLFDARAICRQLGNVWFDSEERPVAGLRRVTKTVYRVYRRGMGCFAERSSPAELARLLRKQLPVEVKL